MSSTVARNKLTALVGTFDVHEVLAPSPSMPEGGTARARSVSRLECGGLFVVTDYAQLQDDEVVFCGHGVYGYDAHESCYTMYWFDSATPRGFVPPARGTWKDDTLTFVRHAEHGWGRYTYRFADDGYQFRLETSPDGETWSVLMNSVYTRTASRGFQEPTAPWKS